LLGIAGFVAGRIAQRSVCVYISLFHGTLQHRRVSVCVSSGHSPIQLKAVLVVDHGGLDSQQRTNDQVLCSPQTQTHTHTYTHASFKRSSHCGHSSTLAAMSLAFVHICAYISLPLSLSLSVCVCVCVPVPWHCTEPVCCGRAHWWRLPRVVTS
jgi:hypothetical protein